MNLDQILDISRNNPKFRPTFRLIKIPSRWKNEMQEGDELQLIDSTTFFNLRLRMGYKFVAYSCLEFIDYKPDATIGSDPNMRLA